MAIPYFATQVRVADAGGALERGQRLADMVKQSQYNEEQRALANEMRSRVPELYGGAMRGDENSLAQLAGYSPQLANSLASFAQSKSMQDKAAALNERKFNFSQEQAGLQNQLARDKFNFARNNSNRDYALRQEMQALRMQQMQNEINSQAYQQEKQIMSDTYRNLLNAPADQRAAIYEASKEMARSKGIDIPEELDVPYSDNILNDLRDTLGSVNRVESLASDGVDLLTAQREDPFYKERAKRVAIEFTQVQDDGVKARSVLPKLDVLEGALEAYSKGGSQAKMSLANGLKYLGFNVDKNDTAGEMIEALGNQLALGNRGELGPGTMTNEDFQILKSYVPTLGKSPEANRIIINILRKTSQRNIALAEHSRFLEQQPLPAITMASELDKFRNTLDEKDRVDAEQGLKMQQQRLEQFQNALSGLSTQSAENLQGLYDGIAD